MEVVRLRTRIVAPIVGVIIVLAAAGSALFGEVWLFLALDCDIAPGLRLVAAACPFATLIAADVLYLAVRRKW